ncbi:hypothetical protein [Chromobacterium violaceum]|uniref:hypothetical protein n=1 Tax=Chromobacterium violaceum TaxID=536 RepID=UPI001CB5A9DF|nr:hypothetical protein [Chromobacterium violaceum]STB63589.1 Uncharacterised protein [Chromobacterium violaceum]
MLQYNRTPGNGMALDERVTRQTANALGQTDSQIDPRLFSAGSTRPNFRYGLSLSGQTLSSASVGRGRALSIDGHRGPPMLEPGIAEAINGNSTTTAWAAQAR